MESGLLKAFIEGGIGIGLAVAMVGVLFLIVRHVLKSQDKILDMATKQNESWQKVINEHTQQAKVFHDGVVEAHKYQREEHKAQIDGITCHDKNLSSFRTFVEMNLEHRRKEQEKILEALQKVCTNLSEVSITLGRINGYKHD